MSSGVHKHFLQCREQSQSTQDFILIYSHLISFSPTPTPVLAVTENNVFVGGFKTSERERTSTAVNFVVRQGTVLKK